MNGNYYAKILKETIFLNSLQYNKFYDHCAQGLDKTFSE
jgi:hypothetical protein